jgi:uncharacterized membrane protein YedE/YeeE
MSHTRQRAVTAALIGVLFGAGLALGGMTDPRVVLGFLDPAGQWDPRLLFVMGGGLAFSIAGVWFAKRRGRPFLADHLQLPTRHDIDWRLVVGATIFGIGWGVAGYCPAPGLAALVINPGEAIVFVPALLAGSWLARRFG